MAKFDPTKWPKLQQYWDVEYGMAIPFNQVFDIKFQSHSGYNGGYTQESSSGGYAVVACKNAGGSIELADLSLADGAWDMINDGFESITEADWKKLTLVPECDWFKIPGNESFM